MAFRGTLLSRAAVEALEGPAYRDRLGADTRARAWREMRRWWRSAGSTLGPTAGARSVFDRAGAPLAGLLGYAPPVPSRPEALHAGGSSRPRDSHHAGSRTGGSTISAMLLDPQTGLTAPLIVTPWGEDLGREWRRAARLGIASGASWSFCCNGTHLRLVDVRRTFARCFIEFDLAAAALDEQAFAILWALAHPRARRPVGPDPPDRCLIDEVAALAERLSAAGAAALQQGVHQVLIGLTGALVSRRRRTREHVDAAFHESLTFVYRLLFLLFAEARGLLPLWHSVYRDAYALSTLRGSSLHPDRSRGIWEALQATARLAHAGCAVRDLRTTAFNGPLFAPARAPRLDGTCIPDETAAAALRALTTRTGSAGRTFIHFGDFDVEQLGAVYERVLDYAPRLDIRSPGAEVELERQPIRRKTSGTFYTPRSLTEYLVRHTLGPLVENRTPAAILKLRVLDPAMGSGAFLVAACRYLARAYEHALREAGEADPGEIGDVERAAFRRLVARHCLYGVDVNPTAVQIARLSLWLATLSADRPLTFLDHHLRTGDSLIGASLIDLTRHPARLRRALPRGATGLPLFEIAGLSEDLRAALPDHYRLAEEPDDSVDAVRRKERTFAHLQGRGSPVARWRAAADLWCACWSGSDASAALADIYPDLLARLMRDAGTLPDRLTSDLLNDAARLARDLRFFHWSLEFPEVFFDRHGRQHEEAGFDAVLSNPPWDVLRADLGAVETRHVLRSAHDRRVAFVRSSGAYRAQPSGHANQYQLFVERATSLVRPGGRLGLIVPWGFAADQGSAPVRRWLFDRADIENIVALDNRIGIFPVHRSIRFVLLTGTAGRPTRTIRCRLGLRDADALETLPEAGPETASRETPILVSRDFLRRVSGDGLAFPDLRSPLDVVILDRLNARHPRLSAGDGWGLRFGRELNATEDRHRFVSPERGSIPVIEGKQIEAFRVDTARSRWALPRSAVPGLPRSAGGVNRPRLAFRDVAAATNRITLIAAIVPAGVATTHTVLCLKTPLAEAEQHYLCGMFNSFVANYLVRLRVGCHVTATIIAALPMPRPPVDEPGHRAVQVCAARLIEQPHDEAAYIRLQAAAAGLFGLSKAELAHVLDTFPLVAREVREATLAAFSAAAGG